MSLIQIVGISCFTGALILAALALFLGRKAQKKRGLGGGRFSATVISFYHLLNHYSFLRMLIQPIRKRLEFYSDFDERAIRKKTVIVFFITIGCFLTALVLFWVLTQDAVMLLIFAALLSLMADTIVDIFVSNLYTRIMKQQLHYHELLRHKYYELKSVEDANYEACTELNKKGSFEIYIQSERINDILSAKDMEESLQKYYDTAPNKYLKLLAGMIYITKEYGDTKVDGCSVFIKGIGYLSGEIRAEIFKRDKLKFALRSLNIISLVPIFLVKPLRQWAGSSFAPLENFYVSRTGIILGLITILSAFVSYMTLRRIQRFDKVVKTDLGKRSLEDKLYQRLLYPIVDRLVPKSYTKKKKEIDELIKGSISQITIQSLYVRRILVGAGVFLLGLILFVGLNLNNVYRVLHVAEMPQGYLGGKLSEDDMKRLLAITEMDRDIIEKLTKPVSLDQLENLLIQKGFEDEASQKIAVNRVLDKLSRIESSYFKWYELVFCIFFFIIGYYMPLISLRFLKSVRRIDMEEEVAQFQTIILMLMHMGRIHVEEVIEWLEMFSVHFKGPIQKCLSNFSSGSSEALEVLKEDVAFPPFIGLIENLQLANEELGVERAFEELENEMTYNQEKRQHINEHIVESKKNLGNMIGFFPVYALITLYLIIPMILSGMESISSFYKQISGL